MTHRKHKHFDLQQKFYGEYGRYRCFVKHATRGIWGEARTPGWFEGMEYKLEEIRPMYQLNGVQYPAPETEPLKMGQAYFISAPTLNEMCGSFSWAGNKFDYWHLVSGLIHLTKESAIQHATAMLAGKPVENGE